MEESERHEMRCSGSLRFWSDDDAKPNLAGELERKNARFRVCRSSQSNVADVNRVIGIVEVFMSRHVCL